MTLLHGAETEYYGGHIPEDGAIIPRSEIVEELQRRGHSEDQIREIIHPSQRELDKQERERVAREGVTAFFESDGTGV